MTPTKIEEIHQWWVEHLNLASVFDDTLPISLCLDAQRRFNEQHNFDPQFNRMNVPLVIRMFRESKAYKRNHIANFRENVDAQIYMFKTKWNPPNVDGVGRLDSERGYLEQLAPEITKEFDDLFMDVMNEEIIFYGIGCLNDGTLTLTFSK